MFKKISLIILSIIFCSYFVNASYYADVVIDVRENGLVEIKGESNHPMLNSGIYDNLTTKQKGYWILNISTFERFSEYSYELILPKNSKINYLGVFGVDKFEDTNGFKISGDVRNKPFAIVIQYKYSLIKNNYLPYVVILCLVLVIAVANYLFKKNKKSKKTYHKEDFSEREYLIIQFLQKNKGCLTQAELEKKTNLPKSSLSRNIESLLRKKVIEKNKSGMTNKIKLI